MRKEDDEGRKEWFGIQIWRRGRGQDVRHANAEEIPESEASQRTSAVGMQMTYERNGRRGAK